MKVRCFSAQSRLSPLLRGGLKSCVCQAVYAYTAFIPPCIRHADDCLPAVSCFAARFVCFRCADACVGAIVTEERDAAAGEAPRADYASLRFLVIDDSPAARESLRHCAQALGAFTVDFARGYPDALARVRAVLPDVILCEYQFEDGRTGQQLLEEMRRSSLLRDETVFIMVTAEKAYERVVAAVELVPDDYVIKPFSPQRLNSRLERALRRKRFLRPFFAARRSGDLAAAERFFRANANSEEGRTFRFDLARVRAEWLFANGALDKALEAYRSIVAEHAVPWAQAGEARTLLALGRLREARAAVDEVVARSPLYFDAFDLKTRICLEQGDHAEAQRTVAQTAQRTVRNVARKRLLAEVALLNGDKQTAIAAMTEILQNDAPGAEVAQASDRLMLARAHLAAGNVAPAEITLRALAADELGQAPADVEVALRSLRVLLDPVVNVNELDCCATLFERDEIGMEARLDLIRAAFAAGRAELAEAVAQKLFEAGQIRPAFASVRALFAENGCEERFRSMQKEAAMRLIRGNGDEGEHAPEAGVAE